MSALIGRDTQPAAAAVLSARRQLWLDAGIDWIGVYGLTAHMFPEQGWK